MLALTDRMPRIDEAAFEAACEADAAYAESLALLDEMDAPEWDSGTVTFDPYL